MKRTYFVTVLMALALLVAGCGDDDGGFGIGDPDTTAAETTATTEGATTTAGTTATTEAATTTAGTTATTEAATTTAGTTATTEAATTTEAPVVTGSCDAPAVPINVGDVINDELQATSQPYPATATYFCVEVGGRPDRLVIELSGIVADLDLYVGRGGIETVQGADIIQDTTYQWKSNDFGTVDERVIVNLPEAGTYYIEIASYEGDYSPFRLTVAAE